MLVVVESSLTTIAAGATPAFKARKRRMGIQEAPGLDWSWRPLLSPKTAPATKHHHPASFFSVFPPLLLRNFHQMSNGKNPGCLDYVGDYTTQLYRDYNKPL